MERNNNQFESGSRFEQSQRKTNNGTIAKVVLSIAVIVFIVIANSPERIPVMSEETFVEGLNEAVEAENQSPSLSSEEIDNLKEKIQASLAKKKSLSTANEYIDRAIEREDAQDYTGAEVDYTESIALATTYSEEMFTALNNRGVVRVDQLRDYRGALKDFTKIIDIELNRASGEPNLNRLELGYTNRAYVKNLKGDSEGACDDLYEALGLGVEKSVTFIEAQIEKMCNY